MKLAKKIIASVVTGAMLISNVSAATSVIADQTESTETEVVITEATESNETSETSLETTANVVIDDTSETSLGIEYIEETEDLIETEVTVVTEEEVISSETNTDPTDNTIVETVESTIVTEETTETSETEEIEYVVFDHYYSEINASLVSTSELFVITSDPSVFTRNTNVVSNYDDAYIIECASVEEARFVYSYYVDKVDFIADMSDVASVATDDVDETTPVVEETEGAGSEETAEVSETIVPEETVVETEPATAETTVETTTVEPTPVEQEPDLADLSDLNNGNDAIANLNGIDTVHNDYSGYIALIDTGANAHANFTVLGGDTFDYNGHGTSMYGYIRSENPSAQVVSIKVSENGSASAADIYAGFRLAIDLNVSVINFSMTAPDTAKNAVIRDIIQEALDAGIVVIGAAGNNSISATHFIPSCIDGVITVGAVDADGNKIRSSNYNADYYVVADSTSEATARYTGLYTAGLADISIKVFDQVVEDDDYVPDDYAWAYEAAEELTNRLQADQGYGYVTFEVDEDGNVWFVYHYDIDGEFVVADWPTSDATINLDHDVSYTVSGTSFSGTCDFTSTDGGKGYATNFSGTLGGWLAAAGISQVPFICSKNFGYEDSNHALSLESGPMNYVASYQDGQWTIMIGSRHQAAQPVWTQLTDTVSYSVSSGGGRYLYVTVGSTTRTVDLQTQSASQVVTEVTDLVKSMTVVGEYNGNKGPCSVNVPSTGVGTHSATRTYWHTDDTQTYEAQITWPSDTPHAAVAIRKVDAESGAGLAGCTITLTGTFDGTPIISGAQSASVNGNTITIVTGTGTVEIQGLAVNSNFTFTETGAPIDSSTGLPYDIASPISATFSTNANGDITNVSASGDWSFASGTGTFTLKNGHTTNPNFSSIGVLKVWPANATNNFWQDTQFLSFAIQFRGNWETYQQYGWGDSWSYGRIRNPNRNAGQAYVGWLTTRDSALAYGGMSLYYGDNQYIPGRYFQHIGPDGRMVDNEGASYDWNQDLLYLPYGYYHITEYWQEAYISAEGQREFSASANASGWTLEAGGPGTGSCQYGIIIKIDGNGTWICDSNGNPVRSISVADGVRLESVANDTLEAALDVRKIDLTGGGIDGASFELYNSNNARIATGNIASTPSGTTTDSEGNTVNYYDVSWDYTYNQAYRADDSAWHYQEHQLTNEAIVQHLNYTTYQIREYITDIETYRVPDGWQGMDADSDGVYEYFYTNVTLDENYHTTAMVVDCGNRLNGLIDVSKVSLTGGPLADLSFEIRNSSNAVVATGYIPADATPETTGTGTATDYTYSANWDYTINGRTITNKPFACVGRGSFTVREYIPVSAFASRDDLTVTSGWTYCGVTTQNGIACYYFTKTVVIDDSNLGEIQTLPITNEIHPTIGTTLTDFANRHITVVGENIEFTDVVAYEGAYIGGSYIMHATLMDAASGQPVRDEDGNVYEAEVPFTASSTGSGTVNVTFTVNTADLVEAVQDANGVVSYSPRSIVCFESMRLVGGYEVANHNDLTDENQTVEIPNPEMGTTFTDLQTREHQVPAGRIVEVVDTVSFANLHAGETYTLTCFLYDKTTGEQLQYSDGTYVTGTREFIPQTESGTIDVTFTIDTSDLIVNVFAYDEGHLVAFEYLRSASGILIGGHTEIDDLDQYNWVPTPPSPRSLLLDDQTGTHEGVIGATVTMTDTLWLEGLNIGESYQIRGSIVDRDNPSVVYATAVVDFVAQARTDSVQIHYTVDTSRACEGNREAYLVCFEEIWQLDTQNTGRGEVMLTRHADVHDQDQSIHLVPEIHTQMTDPVTGCNYGLIGENVEFIDTVSFHNLHIGETYTVSGVIMDKQTGEPVLDRNGQPYTASTTFVPETSDGTVDVVYHVDTLYLISQIGQTVNGITVEAPREIVSFETITSTSGFDFEIHADIEDEGQTIILGDIRSGAGDTQTSTSWLAAGLTTIRDTVHYRGLGPVEYTVRGSLHLISYDENGNAIDGGLIQARPGEITETEYTWTPTNHEGDINLDYKLNSDRFEGQNIIVFEELWYNGVCIISHEHYCDSNGNYGMDNLEQTVRRAEVHTNAFSYQTGAQMVAYDTEATITDSVYYGNVEVGQSYYVEGSLWGCYTDENGYIHSTPITQEEGGRSNSAVFTATESSGVVEVLFTINSTMLSDRGFDYVVVTERLIHVGSGVSIADHMDLTDQAQTIQVPNVHTTATTETGHTLPEGTNADIRPVTVTDRVYYENLIPGKSYTVVGNLQYARTDAEGNITESGALVQNGQPVTATKTFVPEASTGYIDLEFTVNAADIMAHGYNRIVVFEDLYFGPEGIRVAVHADITDEEQTIFVPPTNTPTPTPTIPGTPPKTGDESGYGEAMFGAVVAVIILAAGVAALAILDRKKK